MSFDGRKLIGDIFIETILVLLLISNGMAGYHAFSECSKGNEFSGFHEDATRLERLFGYIAGYTGAKAGCWLGQKVDDEDS